MPYEYEDLEELIESGHFEMVDVLRHNLEAAEHALLAEQALHEGTLVEKAYYKDKSEKLENRVKEDDNYQIDLQYIHGAYRELVQLVSSVTEGNLTSKDEVTAKKLRRRVVFLKKRTEEISSELTRKLAEIRAGVDTETPPGETLEREIV